MVKSCAFIGVEEEMVCSGVGRGDCGEGHGFWSGCVRLGAP